MTKTERRISYFKKAGVQFIDEMPKGWKILKGATTAPNGYVWVHNLGNPFAGDCKIALLKV